MHVSAFRRASLPVRPFGPIERLCLHANCTRGPRRAFSSSGARLMTNESAWSGVRLIRSLSTASDSISVLASAPQSVFVVLESRGGLRVIGEPDGGHNVRRPATPIAPRRDHD